MIKNKRTEAQTTVSTITLRKSKEAAKKNRFFGGVFRAEEPTLNRGAEAAAHGDIFLIVLPVVLAALGVLFVYSASYYTATVQYGDAFFFAKKQLIGFAAGVVALVLAAKFDYTKLRKKTFRYIFYFVSAALLALVFVPGVSSSSARPVKIS